MSAVDEILAALPVEEVARRSGCSPDEVRTTAAAIVPALLGGMQANAAHPSGATSLVEALGQHDDDLLSGGADLGQVSVADGQVISQHVFGDQQDEVAARLGGIPGVGGAGFGGAIVNKLIPILAPMVLSWLANKVLRGGGSGSTTTPSTPSAPAPSGTGTPSLPGGGGGAAPGSLEDLLRDVLGGATSGGASPAPSGGSTPGAGSSGIDAGSIIKDVLGGILGNGRR
ncbi:DUF937 domain-containing protein [Oryzobacter telluris]|uniref:DUF937 domain-containing protein n=1 Tax=Oryzobacter telluris TaxID=3149179 RepID=UPI00370D036D